jgi:NAD(P)-dependent dehydrogenase (short-subunit alcohol dehydrogenase family)
VGARFVNQPHRDILSRSGGIARHDCRRHRGAIVAVASTNGFWVEPKSSQYRSRIPLGRFGEPSDIADAITFLASDQSGWITGQTLVVDGGQTLGRV